MAYKNYWYSKVLNESNIHPTLQIYWMGPILGGMCAGMVYQMVFKISESETYSSIDALEENKA